MSETITPGPGFRWSAPAVRVAVLAVAIGLVYFAAARLGLMLAVVSPQVTAVWPPAGIALAAVLLLGFRVWPGIAAGAFGANLLEDSTWGVAAGIAAGNTLAAVVAAGLLRRVAAFRSEFERPKDVLALAFLGAGVGPVLSATVGANSLCLGGLAEWRLYGALWSTWWLGDAMGILVVAPAILTWASRPPLREAPIRLAEAATLLVLVAVVGVVLFVADPARTERLTYLVLPLFVWCGLRQLQAVTAAAVVIVSAIAVWGVVRRSADLSDAALNERLLLLQTFMGVTAVTALALGASVAQRRRAESLMRESEERLHLALEAGRMGTWTWDIGTGRVAWSPGLERLHGLGPGAFEGTFAAVLRRVHPEDRGAVAEAVRRAAAEGAGHQVEYRIVRADGSVAWVEGRGRVVLDGEGRPAHMIGVAADISERRRAQEELAAKAAELERSNADLEDFAHVASHDLKEPLRGINLYAGILLEEHGERIGAEGRSTLEALQRLSRRMTELINALLDYSKLGRTDLAVAEADLNEVVTETLASLLPRLEHDGAEVRVAGPLPTVRCDRVRVSQVFANLVSNAVKYNDKERKVVEIGVRPMDERGSPALYVKDNGIGIPEGQQDQLFRMFKRLHTRHGSGTGAGLAIVKGIVERHGGVVWCESEPGEGATFYFTLGAGGSGASDRPR